MKTMNLSYLFSVSIGFILFFGLAQAQNLQRKAWFGAQLEEADSSGDKGLKIIRVVGGTSQALKLKPGDLILNVNQERVVNMQDFQNALMNQRENQQVHITLIRKNKKQNIKGKFAGRAFETSDNTDVVYTDAPYKDGKLRVIINKPKKSGKLPALLFIPGYTCSSIDNLPSNHPYKRIIDEYANAGFLTLRIEKSGLGDSENTPACESCDLFDEIENFEVGLKKLKSLPEVDTNQIIIYGHSMGGVIAPALGAKHRIAGVVVYGTTAKSWFEYQLEMYRVQNKLVGMDPIEYEQSIVNQYDLNYQFFVKKQSLKELAKDPKSDSLLRTQWMYNGENMIYSRNAEYWRQIQDVSHLDNWKNTQAKVLVQFGESDFQAFSLADHQQIVDACNYYKPQSATLQTFASTDHFFAKSGTMQDAYDTFSSGQYQKLFDAYNFDVGKQAVNWSLDVILQKNK